MPPAPKADQCRRCNRHVAARRRFISRLGLRVIGKGAASKRGLIGCTRSPIWLSGPNRLARPIMPAMSCEFRGSRGIVSEDEALSQGTNNAAVAWFKRSDDPCPRGSFDGYNGPRPVPAGPFECPRRRPQLLRLGPSIVLSHTGIISAWLMEFTNIRLIVAVCFGVTFYDLALASVFDCHDRVLWTDRFLPRKDEQILC
jgi:hypothetical protein